MDTAKWPQEFLVKPMNEIVTNTCLKQPNPPPPPASAGGPVERKARPEKDEALNCPRCNSLNTKFCYYNNYSLTQPRFFCKDCRRYWTAGGSLRNIPVGGGIRKNKRSSPSPSSSSSSKKPLLVNTPAPVPLPQLNPKKTGENSHEATAAKAQDLSFSQGFGLGNGQGSAVKDLNSVFSQGFGINVHPHHQSIPEFLLPSTIKNNSNPLVSTSSALELLGISNSSNSRPSYMPFPNVHDTSMSYTAAASGGFGLNYPQFQDFMRPTLGFSLDGGGYGGDHEGSTTTNNGRTLLQFESLKMPVSSSSTNSGGNEHQSGNEREKEGEEADQSGGFWNGMLNAGTSATSGGSGSWQ